MVACIYCRTDTQLNTLQNALFCHALNHSCLLACQCRLARHALQRIPHHAGVCHGGEHLHFTAVTKHLPRLHLHIAAGHAARSAQQAAVK